VIGADSKGGEMAAHNHAGGCTACDDLLTSAEAANRAKDDFFLTLSHELRGPLNAITGWAHILRGRTATDELAMRALATIERNVEVQARLITDMLDVSQVISGKLRLVRSAVDLVALVNDSAASMRPSTDGRDILVETDSPVGPISGDPDRLRQVMHNLLHNAVKFTPEGGRITVRVGATASDVTIAVQDSGMGIRPDVLPHVFERFWQDAGSRVGGLGIGLAVVRHLVELHGGTVAAASEGENHGATFTVTLPGGAAPLFPIADLGAIPPQTDVVG
jgi:signal transduction histidine kinase